MADFRKDDEGRRYGDWMHKDLRGDPNYFDIGLEQEPWYKQTVWILFFLVVLWPVGIVLCWRSNWPLAGKITASIFLAIIVGFVSLMQYAFLQMLIGS